MIAAGVLGLALLAMTVAYFNRSATDARAVQLAFVPPENVTFDNGLDDYVIVSPDGQKIAFTGRSADGRRQLWVRSLDATEAQPLSGTDDPLRPFWSPDSRSLGFGSQGKLKRIDLAGGRPQVLCDSASFGGGTWGRDGVILFAPTVGGALLQTPTAGGVPKPASQLNSARSEVAHVSPYFLPDGRHFIFGAAGRNGERDLFTGSLDPPEVKHLLSDSLLAAYAPPGWLLFVRGSKLLAQAFDAERQELKGEPISIAKQADSSKEFSAASEIGPAFSISENGVLIWQGGRTHEYQVVWFERDGKQGNAILPSRLATGGNNPRLSPEGKRVAVHRVDLQFQTSDIWVVDLVRNLPARLTSDPARDQWPIWSPDGNQVLFQASRGGVPGFYKRLANGIGGEELLFKGGSFPSDWSHDGRFIIYNPRSEKTRRDVWALPLFGDRQPVPLISTEFDEYRGQLSPDGRWLAYVSDESGSYEIYVRPFKPSGNEGNGKWRISSKGGNQPRWRRDGQELFYAAADMQMMAVTVKPSGATFEFETPKALFKTRMFAVLNHSGIEYDVTADEQRFLIGTQVGEGTPVSVILNWTEGLKK